MGHRHQDSRAKWTTTDNAESHPADVLTSQEVDWVKLLIVAAGGGGTTPVPNPPPTPPPNIAPTGITVSGVTTTTATVSWTTTDASTGLVQYGTTTGYGSTTTLEASYLTAHSQTLTPLLPNTLYHLRVRSADAAGNLALSSDRSFTTTATPPPSGGYPPDTTLTYVATPGTARPAYLVQTTDPTWGTQVIRIADQSAFGTSQTVLRHAYSKVQPWNADETYYLIGFLFPGHLLNGKTFARIRGISQPSDARWSNTNPDILYGTQGGNLFVKRLISTDVQSTVHAFNAAYSAMDIGRGEGNLSLDDRYVALTATRGGTTWIIVYDITLNAVVVEKDMGGTTVYDCTMSPSGAYVVVSTPGGLDVYDRNMVYLRHLTSISAHYDVGYNAAGQEIAITSVGQLPTFRLSDGVQVNAYPANNTIIMGESHVSMRATSRPGWCVVTHYNQRTVDEGSDQVFAIKTDGSGTVEVFGFAHHNTSGAGAGYDAQPQAVPSKDLTRIAVASEWDQNPITNIYDYVMGMDVLR